MASFDSFKCIKNIELKLDFNNHKIIDLIQILIENLIMIMESRALLGCTHKFRMSHTVE